MKKNVWLIFVAVLAVMICAALLIHYKTDDLGQPVICISIDENGNFTGAAATFATDVEQVTFVCRRKKPFIGKATISWYSDSDNNTPVKTETVSVNKAGYYVSTFSQEDGLTTGDYHTYIDVSYALGKSKSVANFTVE